MGGVQPRAAVLLAVAVAAVVALAGCGSTAATRPAGHASRHAQRQASAIGLSAGGFEPAAASFVSPRHGWVLGYGRCESCAALRETADGGRIWTVLPAPPAALGFATTPTGAVTNIAFANAANGFLYGPGLLATHDGGRSWTRQSLPPVETLAVSGGYGYAITVTPRTMAASLYRTAIGSDRWTRLKLPRGAGRPVSYNHPNGQLLLQVEGRTVMLLRPGFTGPANTAGMVGRLWVSSTAGTGWRSRAVPCRAPTGGGAAVLSIALGHPDAWLVDCFNNEQSSQEQNTQHHLFGTADGGLSWVRLPDPTRHNMPVLLADNGSEHAFLATEGTTDVLVGTVDGGLHWHTVIKSGGSFSGWADLGFVTSQIGFVVGPTHYAPEHLYRTSNGGRTWQIVRF
jgi:photosystem II stability/assembly factor-like uncharacterized protein